MHQSLHHSSWKKVIVELCYAMFCACFCTNVFSEMFMAEPEPTIPQPQHLCNMAHIPTRYTTMYGIAPRPKSASPVPYLQSSKTWSRVFAGFPMGACSGPTFVQRDLKDGPPACGLWSRMVLSCFFERWGPFGSIESRLKAVRVPLGWRLCSERLADQAPLTESCTFVA